MEKKTTKYLIYNEYIANLFLDSVLINKNNIEKKLLSANDLLNGLNYCAQHLNSNCYNEIVCVGGGALALFYGYNSPTEDLDAINTVNPPSLSPDLKAIALQYSMEKGIQPDWFNDHIQHIIEVGPQEYQEHINRNIYFDFQNAEDIITIRLFPITIEAIAKQKIAVSMMRNKDIPHLHYIIKLLEWNTPEDFIHGLVNNGYPYIEDDWNWDIWRTNIENLYYS